MKKTMFALSVLSAMSFSSINTQFLIKGRDGKIGWRDVEYYSKNPEKVDDMNVHLDLATDTSGENQNWNTVSFVGGMTVVDGNMCKNADEIMEALKK